MADDAKWEALMRKAAGADDYQRAVSPPPPNKKAAKAHKRALKAWLAAPAACDGAAEQLACLFEPSACSRPGKPGPLVVIHDFLPTDAAQGALVALNVHGGRLAAAGPVDRLAAAEELNSELHERNQMLSSSVAEEARSRARATPSKEAEATVSRLEAEVARARQEKAAAVESQGKVARDMEALAADL